MGIKRLTYISYNDRILNIVGPAGFFDFGAHFRRQLVFLEDFKLASFGWGVIFPLLRFVAFQTEKMRNTEKIPLGIFENITKTNEEESKSTEIDKWCGRSYIIYIYFFFLNLLISYLLI